MRLLTVTCLSTALLAGAAFPVHAQSLLGGVLGGSDDRSLVTIGSGDAGESGLVNLGLGGDDQVLDANIGNGRIGSATVGSGGGSVLDADVNLLDGAARVGVDVGGDNLLDVDIGVGGSDGDGNGGGNGGGGNGGGGNGGGGLLPGSSLATSGSAMPTCQGVSSRDIEQLILSTRIDASWRRASNVDVRKVSVCPELRAWLAAALTQTGLGPSLRSAIASDELLTASLNRSPHSAERVFAVQRSGDRLTVFVY